MKSESDSIELVEFNCSGYLRFALMIFVAIWAFGCPDPTGIAAALSGFATPCFFILSGYFVLVDKREERLVKLGRKLKRGLLCLAAVLVLYVAINVAVCFLTHITVQVTRRVVFNFVVLNLWPLPVGDNFWFIQALVYAYIVIFIADKLKLMRFYKIVLIVTVLIMLLTGEFAGVIGFNVLGYPYIPGNWLTRAIPYILLGRLLREKKDWFLSVRKWKYIVMFLIGGGLVILELFILGRTGNLVYEGHMIGYGIMAFSICALALSIPILSGNRVSHFDPAISGIIYILMNPVYWVMMIFLRLQHPDFMYYFGTLTAYLVSMILALILANTRVSNLFFTNWEQRLAGAENIEEMDD